MTIQAKTKNLNYLIDPTFTKVNRLFVLPLKKKMIELLFLSIIYLMLKLKTNVLIDGKSFFDIPIKNKEETYDKIIEVSKNNDYTTGNLFDYDYFSKHYKLIVIDLSKQVKLKDADLKQQINFIGRLEREAMFVIIEKTEETAFNFSKNSVSIK